MRSPSFLLPFALCAAACQDPDDRREPAVDSTLGGLSNDDGTASDDDDGIPDRERLDVGGGGGATSSTVDSEGGGTCVGLLAVVRDFKTSHPDFETYLGNGAHVGLVLPTLTDGKPVYNPAYNGQPMINSAETFAQWYVDLDGVNQAFEISLPLYEEQPGSYVYDSNAFFPIDGKGFGNEGNPHNFHFTTEVRTSFTYEGGEVFTFRGDDDLWLFVDGRLALDIGGLHEAVEGTVRMDELGLTRGNTYKMDIFHAERHTVESNFRIATTIDCFYQPIG